MCAVTLTRQYIVTLAKFAASFLNRNLTTHRESKLVTEPHASCYLRTMFIFHFNFAE
jgi:hypothetical protein